jgi:hypothetical protein
MRVLAALRTKTVEQVEQGPLLVYVCQVIKPD